MNLSTVGDIEISSETLVYAALKSTVTFLASWCLIMRSLRTNNILCYWRQTCTYSILDLHNDLHECFDWRVNNDLSFSRFLTLDQGWRTLVLKSRSPAEFSSNPNKNSPACSFLVTLQTLIRFFRCVWLGLKQKSAGLCGSPGPTFATPALDALDHLMVSENV